MSLRLETLTGDNIARVIDGVAQLRIRVFRDWPYLYDGDLAYERSYLQSYQTTPRALVVAAWAGEQLVGASTALPLGDADPDFAKAFDGSGYRVSDIFYCAESVLLPEYRGQGAGHRFFDLREEHAKASDFAHSAFCSVIRPSDHPARPPAYRPLDPFWRDRGYHPLEDVIARFAWRDLGATDESDKALQFWIKPL